MLAVGTFHRERLTPLKDYYDQYALQAYQVSNVAAAYAGSTIVMPSEVPFNQPMEFIDLTGVASDDDSDDSDDNTGAGGVDNTGAGGVDVEDAGLRIFLKDMGVPEKGGGSSSSAIPAKVGGGSSSSAIPAKVKRRAQSSSRAAASSAAAVAAEVAPMMKPPPQFTLEAYRQSRKGARGRIGGKRRRKSAGSMAGDGGARDGGARRKNSVAERSSRAVVRNSNDSSSAVSALRKW